jgi:hypothetical protein
MAVSRTTALQPDKKDALLKPRCRPSRQSRDFEAQNLPQSLFRRLRKARCCWRLPARRTDSCQADTLFAELATDFFREFKEILNRVFCTLRFKGANQIVPVFKDVHMIPTFPNLVGNFPVYKNACKGEGGAARFPCTREILSLCNH